MSTILHGIERMAAKSIVKHLYDSLADSAERAETLEKCA